MHKYNISDETDNRIVVRFVPMSVNICMYCINHTIFSAPYLLAKQDIRDDRCVTMAPVVEIDDRNDEHKKIFDALLDHFRYLWELPHTILSRDATSYEPTKPYLIKDIKSPYEIKFSHKFPNTIESHVTNRVQVGYLLRQLCPKLPEKTPTHESIFIACSWRREHKNSLPNSLARSLKEWLEFDFGSNVMIELVNAPGGEGLKDILFKKLNASSIGIIIVTADIKDENGIKYAKPNIYQELGYLMGRFSGEGIGNNRVLPIVEKGVEWPSNVKDLVYHEFEEETLVFIYDKILEDLERLLTIDQSKICKAFDEHKKRVQKLYQKKKDHLKKTDVSDLIKDLTFKQTLYSCAKCSANHGCTHKEAKNAASEQS